MFLLHNKHDVVIKWKHFPRYWPFVRGIQRPPVNCPHEDQWRGALMFSLICVLDKRLSRYWWGWWFETPSRSVWRLGNALSPLIYYAKISPNEHIFSITANVSMIHKYIYICYLLGMRFILSFLHQWWDLLMMTSWNWSILRFISHLCGEITDHRWIPLTKASNAELWYFLSSAPGHVLLRFVWFLI